MNKPDEIPQDVWDEAILYSGVYAEPAGETLTDLRMDFARAIMNAKAEERKACIAAAEKERLLGFYVNPEDAPDSDKAYDMAINHVIDAIRAR